MLNLKIPIIQELFKDDNYIYIYGETASAAAINSITAKLVNGNAGRLVNMATDDFVGDTP